MFDRLNPILQSDAGALRVFLQGCPKFAAASAQMALTGMQPSPAGALGLILHE